jgi:hypothetical protein
MELSTSARHSLFGWAVWPLLAICALLFGAYTLGMINHMGADYEIIRHDVDLFRSDPGLLYRPDVLQSMVGFLYPPPSILLFLPFSLLPDGAGYLAFIAFLGVSMSAAIVLWLRMMRRAAVLPPVVSAADWLVLFAMGLTARPMYDAVLQGQIDPFVLLLCVGYVACMRSRLPVLGGSILALGCWIKIYPVLLLVDALRRAERGRCLAGFFATEVLIPVVALPLVPVSLYVRYFTAALPALSGQAITNIYNQSAAAFVGRMTVPLSESMTVFQSHPVALVTRAGILLALAAALALMTIRARRGTRNDLLIAASVMALIAPVAPLGWGHTYVYVVPLLYVTATSALTSRAWGKLAACAVVLLILTVPAHHHFPPLGFVPFIAVDLLYSHYLVATVALLMVAWVWKTVPDKVKAGSRGVAAPAAQRG